MSEIQFIIQFGYNNLLSHRILVSRTLLITSERKCEKKKNRISRVFSLAQSIGNIIPVPKT